MERDGFQALPDQVSIPLLLMVVLALVLAACGTADDEPAAPDEPPAQEDEPPAQEPEDEGEEEDVVAESVDHGRVTIRTNWAAGGMHAPLFYGIQSGFYEEEGIDFEVLDGTGTLSAIEDVSAGNVDFALAGTGPAILGIDEGRPIISVGTAYGVTTYGFFVDPDTGVERIEDMEGVTVIVSPGSPETILQPAVFALAGVDEDQVPLINVDAAVKIGTYAGGDGEALGTSIPFVQPFVQPARPSTELLWADIGFVLPDYNFYVRQETLEERSDMIRAWLRATYRSFVAALENPEEAVEALMEFREEAEFDPTLAQWEGFIPHICSAAMNGQALGRHAEDDWESAIDLLAAYADLQDEDPSVQYTNEFFDQGESVTDVTCPVG